MKELLRLIVRIEYEPQRLQALLEMQTKEVALTVRRDLSLLNLPIASEANIRPTPEGVLVSWVTRKDSVCGDTFSR